MAGNIVLAAALGCVIAILGLYIAYVVIYVLCQLLYVVWHICVVEPLEILFYKIKQKKLNSKKEV